jgi:HD-GYP domain-containing protein (c-di-GMP phosphodiesterase class II)
MEVAGKFDPFDQVDGKPKEEALQQPASSPALTDQASIGENQILQDIPKVRFPIRVKVTLPYLFLALVIAMLGAYIVTRIVFDTIEERFTNQLIETGKMASEWIVREEEKLLETLRLIAHTEGAAEALMAEDAEALREISFPLLLNYSVDALEIIDTTGRSILSLRHREGGRIEEYDVSRDSTYFQDLPITERILNGQADNYGDKFAGIESAPWGDYLYVSGPIYNQEQELVGMILVGDTLAGIAQGIREATLSQVTIYNLEGQEITSTFLDSRPDINEETIEKIVSRQDTKSYLQEISATNISYKEILAPLEVRSGDDVGLIGTSLAQTFLVQASNVTRLQIFAFATTAFLFIIAIGVFIADRFTRPLLNVVRASSEVAAGNLDVTITPTGKDEITSLTHSFNKMVASKSKTDLVQAHQDTIEAYDRTIEGWCKALELRDDVTEGHTQRVTDMTVSIACAMGFNDEQLVHIRRGALMHDIGKMAIPDSILKKPGSLNDREWQVMRNHPNYAYEMLHRIAYLKPALTIPYCHHEKWDGSGYPRGLKEEEIPLEARIFAIADVWDALRSKRPYRAALPVAEVLGMIKKEKGTHFDPQVVDVFLSIVDTHFLETNETSNNNPSKVAQNHDEDLG